MRSKGKRSSVNDDLNEDIILKKDYVNLEELAAEERREDEGEHIIKFSDDEKSDSTGN